MLRLPRRVRHDDAGVGMVEVLVTIVVTSVVGTMITLFFLTSVQATRQADGRNEQAAAARATLESWSVLLRLAVDPLGSTALGTDRYFSVEPTAVRFCAALGTKGDDPDVKPPAIGVRLALENKNLVEYRWTSCATMRVGSLTTYQVKRTLVSGASVLYGVWLVTPLDQADVPDGTRLETGLLASDLTVGSAPLTAENRLRIAGVQLAFQTVGNSRRPASPSTYTTVAALTTGS